MGTDMVMAAAANLGYSREQVDVLKQTIAPGCTDPELALFLYAAVRTGLDPFAKQIYAIRRKGKITIQTSIDGYRAVADRTGRYAPGREPSFVHDEQGQLYSATAYVKKLAGDTWHEYGATVLYQEYVQSYDGKPSETWSKMPHVMLAKCAESSALRKGFPAELSGVYTAEEMDQSDVPGVTIDAEVLPPPHPVAPIPIQGGAKPKITALPPAAPASLNRDAAISKIRRTMNEYYVVTDVSSPNADKDLARLSDDQLIEIGTTEVQRLAGAKNAREQQATGPVPEPATERQIKRLELLADERGVDVVRELGGKALADLALTEAGELITDWQQRPRALQPRTEQAA